MSPAGTVESAPQAPVAAAGPRTPLERAVVALRALLPATAQLAVGWRDATLGSHFLMEPVMQGKAALNDFPFLALAADDMLNHLSWWLDALNSARAAA